MLPCGAHASYHTHKGIQEIEEELTSNWQGAEKRTLEVISWLSPDAEKVLWMWARCKASILIDGVVLHIFPLIFD